MAARCWQLYCSDKLHSVQQNGRSVGRGWWKQAKRTGTCKEVALARAVEADDAVVHGTERPALRLLTVRLEAMDPDILDVHGALSAS